MTQIVIMWTFTCAQLHLSTHNDRETGVNWPCSISTVKYQVASKYFIKVDVTVNQFFCKGGTFNSHSLCSFFSYRAAILMFQQDVPDKLRVFILRAGEKVKSSEPNLGVS